MASRYWVPGGNGNWSSSTNWATTTGGASGAAAPTAADDAFVNALSGTSPTITVDAAATCLSLDFSGAITPTFTGTFGIDIFGSLTLISAMTVTFSGILDFIATATGKTITTAGKSLSSVIVFAGVGGGWTLQDALTTTGSVTHNKGTLDTNGKAVSCLGFNSNTAFTRTLTLGASVLTLASDWWSPTTTGLTFNAGTSTIILTNPTGTFGGGGLTFNNVTFSATNTEIQGANTFNTWTIGAGKIVSITSGTTQTVSNIVSNGVKGNRATIKAVTAASAATISTAATISASHMTVQDITKAGAGSITFHSSLPVSGNTGETFLDRYWIAGTGNTNSTSSWAYVSGGSSGAPVPNTLDSAYFDSASFSGVGQVVTVNAAFSCMDFDWTGATNNPTYNDSSFGTSVYGSFTLISAMTITFAGLAFGATSTGKTITCAGKLLNVTLSFNGIGGGWTLQDAFNNGTSNVITLTNGSLNTNGQTVTTGTFSGSNSNVRGLTLGASTINIALNWTLTTVTNLTFSAGTSTIVMSGTTKAFAGGGLTYNNVTFTGTPITISGSNTFTVLTLSAGKTLNITSGTTQTVTSLICNGTTALPSTLQSVTATSAASIALPAGRYFIRHTSIKDITITGATSTTSIAGTNVSGNTGITFVTKFELGRIKNDGSFNWYSSATGTVDKISG